MCIRGEVEIAEIAAEERIAYRPAHESQFVTGIAEGGRKSRYRFTRRQRRQPRHCVRHTVHIASV